MGNKNKFYEHIIKELEKTYSPPDYINRELILNIKRKEDFKIVNLIFFIMSIIQSLSIILIGLIFISDIFLKIFVIGIGILLFKFSLSVYIVTINKDGVLE